MSICSFMVRQTLHGIPVANVLWFDVGNPYGSDLIDVADEVGAAYVAHLEAIQVPELAGIDCLVRIFDGGSPFSQVIQPAAFPYAGTVGGNPVPANVALLISTSHNGPRPNRGRIYVAGLSEASWDGDSWDATATAAAEAFADALMAINAGTFSIARPNNTTNTAVANRVNDAVSRGYAGSQRGRRF